MHIDLSMLWLRCPTKLQAGTSTSLVSQLLVQTAEVPYIEEVLVQVRQTPRSH